MVGQPNAHGDAHHRGEHHRQQVPGDGAEVHRHGVKVGLGVSAEQAAGDGAHKVFQHPAHHHGISDGDAQNTQQGQDADDSASLFPPLFQYIFKGARGTRPGQTAQAKLARQSHITEQGHKNKVGHQKGAAAVLAHPVGEEPNVAHAHSGAHCGKDESGGGGKLPAGSFMIHF